MVTPRTALAPRTNTLNTPGPQTKLTSFLPTPPDSKRRRIHNDKTPVKRQKLNSSSESEDSEDDYEDDGFTEDTCVASMQARRNTPFQMQVQHISSLAIHSRRLAPSTLPILRSFVSSNKSDVFKCQSIGGDIYLTPPYACSYSHSSKLGGIPLLAVATEQGTMHIMNTTKRNAWDFEPQRITSQPHNNGIFDVKWSIDDKHLATCSGDQSTRISDTETGSITHVLHGHTSTVKCVAWDPCNTSMLSTGGRDGAICLWDLRTGERRQSGGLEIVSASPVATIHGAHDDTIIKSRPKPHKGKQNSTPRTITNLLYASSQPYGLVSSGSFDGILRNWDIRKTSSPGRNNSAKSMKPTELYSSPIDPTTLHGSRRSRGIISLASGIGPSAGLIFAVGADSRVHTYNLPILAAHGSAFQHENLQANSFYVSASVSSCGRWLACGGSGNKGSSFLFDVENACRPSAVSQPGVELRSHAGEVSAVDWAKNMLATCTDDGTVRIWRPNTTTHMECLENPEEKKWDWSWGV